jgi:hypothetical protein
MKSVTKTATVTTAFGIPLSEPVEFAYEYQELQKGDEIPARETPDEEDIRALVNSKRNAGARSKAQAESLKAAGISAPTLEDADFRLRQMVKVLVAAGRSETEAEQVAKAALGM